MKYTYYSQAWQDEFVSNILNFKRDGRFLDIGSADAKALNNSYFFENELGWNGICIELSPIYNDSYSERTCLFINGNAVDIDYLSLIDRRVDYLSVDIDDDIATLKVISNLCSLEHRFSVLTIEHDAYRQGNVLRDEVRSVLLNHGYELLFGDVLVPLGCGMGPDLPFEDWWIDTTMFNMSEIEKLQGLVTDKYPDYIVEILKTSELNLFIGQ